MRRAAGPPCRSGRRARLAEVPSPSMPALLDPIETTRAHLASWDTPFVDLDTFGTADPEAIVSLVDAFCREHLASGIAGHLFRTESQDDHPFDQCKALRGRP